MIVGIAAGSYAPPVDKLQVEVEARTRRAHVRIEESYRSIVRARERIDLRRLPLPLVTPHDARLLRSLSRIDGLLEQRQVDHEVRKTNRRLLIERSRT